MPGVLVIEALAQAGGILTQLTSGGSAAGRLSYLVKIDNAKFSRMVVPGDRLDLEVTIKREIRNMTQYCGTASVDGQQVASADILCAEVRSDVAQASIHASAVVDPSARIGSGVEVGAFPLLGAAVEIGDGTRARPHCSLHGPTPIPPDTPIHPPPP